MWYKYILYAATKYYDVIICLEHNARNLNTMKLYAKHVELLRYEYDLGEECLVESMLLLLEHFFFRIHFPRAHENGKCVEQFMCMSFPYAITWETI